jgi:catechol 2,3-dioxygenase-like lactoylglutathione lyase family enzyme
MLSQYSYPIICAENFVKTVNFYEDHFEFVPAFEMIGFAILERKNWPGMYLGVIDSKHTSLPEQYRNKASGMILNYPVYSVDKTFHELYWEGINIVSDPEDALCGRKHFFVEDPNGILIDVAENIDAEALNIGSKNCEVILA